VLVVWDNGAVAGTPAVAEGSRLHRQSDAADHGGGTQRRPALYLLALANNRGERPHLGQLSPLRQQHEGGWRDWARSQDVGDADVGYKDAARPAHQTARGPFDRVTSSICGRYAKSWSGPSQAD